MKTAGNTAWQTADGRGWVRTEDGTGRDGRRLHADRTADRHVGDADPDDAGGTAAAEAEQAGERDLCDPVGADDRAGGAAVQLGVSGRMDSPVRLRRWAGSRIRERQRRRPRSDSPGPGDGQKSGYTFAITNCTKVTVNNQDMYTWLRDHRRAAVDGQDGRPRLLHGREQHHQATTRRAAPTARSRSSNELGKNEASRRLAAECVC